MSKKTDTFIQTVGTLARNEYLSRSTWILPSVCIAQAALESGWNLKARTLFGIKGKGFTATTTEYYYGHRTVIQDSFRSYPTVAAAVVGYYDFITKTPRYRLACNNKSAGDTVYRLIHTVDGKPYATAPRYVERVLKIIKQYDLTKWDVRGEMSKTKTVPKKTVEAVAREVIARKWGDGLERRKRLTAAGYDYRAVQRKVNELLIK